MNSDEALCHELKKKLKKYWLGFWVKKKIMSPTKDKKNYLVSKKG